MRTKLRRSPLFFTAVSSVLAVACTPAESPLTLHEFDCGVIRFESVALFGIGDDETDVRDLIVPCYVVEHPAGSLLWEGGLPIGLAEAGDWVESPPVLLRLNQTLADQLPAIGHAIDAFDYVAFSHMHFDHVGVASEVQGATLLIQQAEFDAAFADSVTVPFFDPAVYESLRNVPRELLDGEHDVFGDGRVRIIPAPGHTPGHQVLLVDLDEEGPVVLAGDLYHFRESRSDRRVPSINVDSALTVATMERIEQLVIDQGAQLWIEHDMAAFLERQSRSTVHR
jgi:glyoxylase-like metal-dependent hydrolase (beta-lactamase superfamily II)